MSWQVGAFGVLALALAAGFGWYERVRPDARIVALVGTLAAFAALGRIAFVAVPNVKPTTDIVLIAGYALGGGPGFAVGALAGLSSNFFFGQGPWTPWQMGAWGATGVIGAGLAWLMAASAGGAWSRRGRPRADRPAARPLGRWPLAIVCCVVGFGFTVVQDVGDWVTYSDHSWAQLGVYVGRGLGFDAIHAGGCLVFALALGPALTRSVQRFARRLQVTWLPAPGPAGGPLVLAVVAALGLAAALGGPAAPSARAAASPHSARAASSPSARAASSPAASAAAYLLGAQNADGGLGEAPGQPSNQLYAGWAALGLAAAGHDLNRVSRGGAGLMHYVQTAPGATADVGSLERTILVVRAAGLSARSFGGHDLVAALERRIARNGAVSGQVNLTAFAVLALRSDGVAPSARTLGWLAAQQDHDGGFGFAGAGSGSDVDDTGAALEALAGDGSAARVRARAVGFLRRQQNRDGGFPSEPGSGSNAQSTAWAIQGLIAAGVPPASLRRGGAASPVAYLDSLVTSTGAVHYSRGVTQTPVWVTGEALMALEAKPLPIAAPRPPAAPAASTPPATATAPSAPSSAASAGGGSLSRRRGAAVHHRARGAHAGHRPGRLSGGKRASVVSAPDAAITPDERLVGVIGLVTALALAPVGLG
jgi:energy-coupling factor transport system substrate-specific component